VSLLQKSALSARWFHFALSCVVICIFSPANAADDCRRDLVAFPLHTQKHTAIPIDMPKPGKGAVFREPSFGTCMVRLTAHGLEPPVGFARGDYSRRQAFNADNTRVLVSVKDGTWHLYDATTFKYLTALPGVAGAAEPQWDFIDPDKLFFLPRNGVGMKLFELTVSTGSIRTIADFNKRINTLWPGAYSIQTRSEGSPSRDMRYWAFQVEDKQWEGLGFFVYDKIDDRIVATYDLKQALRPKPDHLSMSPSGQFVVVSWNDGPTVFDRQFRNPRLLAKRGEHSDIALDENGDDIYVSVDYEASGGPVYMTNLRTGIRTNLFDTYVGGMATAMHFSGKAYNRPGWVLVSTYRDTPGRLKRLTSLLGRDDAIPWLNRKIFLVQLRANPRIINLAFHRSQFAGYWTEPHASANRDLTRIIFNSNWGTTSETDVDTYLMIQSNDWAKSFR
jgi:hypothetical protein